MKPPYIVALVILVLAIIGTAVSFTGAVAQHVTIKDAMGHAGQVVQVPGMIDKATVHYTAQGGSGELRFDVTDMADPSQRMTIVYHSPKPENFDTAVSVEAIGRYEDGVFVAHNLLVKCPSKYSDEKKSTGG